jgi:amidase
VNYNIANIGTEGGLPGTHPAFSSGQDGFTTSLEFKGKMNETCYQALGFFQRSTREDDIDAALLHKSPTRIAIKLDAPLVQPDIDQICQIAAQAGYPAITLPAGPA